MSFATNIQMKKPAFFIECKVVTPLTQIDPSDEKDLATKASMIKTKTRKNVRADGKVEQIPFFSANALRSMSRTVITQDIHDQLDANSKNGFKFKLPDFQAYTTGGGSDSDSITKSMTFAVENRMREISPFFSVFGIGLGGIEGKSAFASLTPPEGSFQIGATYGVRMDRTKNGVSRVLIDSESIDEWMEEQASNRENNKAYRAAKDALDKLQKARTVAIKNGDDTASLELDIKEAEGKMDEVTKGAMAFQQMYKYEYIVPGTKLYANVASKAGYAFSPIEKGMMLRALIGVATQQLGALKAIGHGFLDWSVIGGNGEKLFSVTSNPDYVMDRTLEITPSGEAILKLYYEWLGSLDEKITVNDIYELAKQTATSNVAKKVGGSAVPDNLFG